MGAGWDFSSTSKTTALPGVCCHFLWRIVPLPEISSLQGTSPGLLDGDKQRGVNELFLKTQTSAEACCGSDFVELGQQLQCNGKKGREPEKKKKR